MTFPRYRRIRRYDEASLCFWKALLMLALFVTLSGLGGCSTAPPNPTKDRIRSESFDECFVAHFGRDRCPLEASSAWCFDVTNRCRVYASRKVIQVCKESPIC